MLSVCVCVYKTHLYVIHMDVENGGKRVIREIMWKDYGLFPLSSSVCQWWLLPLFKWLPKYQCCRALSCASRSTLWSVCDRFVVVIPHGLRIWLWARWWVHWRRKMVQVQISQYWVGSRVTCIHLVFFFFFFND